MDTEGSQSWNSLPSVAAVEFVPGASLLARKPRDIDAELKSLQAKAKALKAKRIVQLGELVVATGADSLDAEVLAGVLLFAVEQAKAPPTREAWRGDGAAFFQRRTARKSADAAGGVGQDASSDSSGSAAR